MDKIRVVKIGGNVIDNPEALSSFLADFANLEGNKILVHGGGKIATELSKSMGITPHMIDGRRVTSQQDLEVVTMVYAGLINKNIVAQLQTKACNAVGFTGADANTIVSDKRPAQPIDFGFVGDVKTVNGKTISGFVEQGVIPVFCAITHDGQGQLLNTNADTIAAEVAASLVGFYDVELIYCFEKQGVLENVEDENSVIPEINPSYYETLKAEGKIHSGMLPKMTNCFDAIKKGVKSVKIGSPQMIGISNISHTQIIS